MHIYLLIDLNMCIRDTHIHINIYSAHAHTHL